MKIAALTLLGSVFAQSDEVTITNKEQKKVKHLKRNYAQMLDLFFINNPDASKPIGAARFGNGLKEKMSKYHDIMVDAWHRCGRASIDPSFERMITEEIRFNHFEPFKGMAQLTNQYRKWIENQIHNGCRVQAREQYFVSKSFFSSLSRFLILR